MHAPPLPDLPVAEALPALRAALADGAPPNAVLEAPPGAGKTTLVPVALAAEPWARCGRLLLLEPRRVAARAAAERIAELMGTELGAGVGLRMRGETRSSRAVRVEVLTEGLLARLLQEDPELPGVAGILFDEVHERSLDGDLGLALAREAQEALRPDLRLLAMSATLDAGPLSAALGGATVVRSAGRMHPVETRWLDAPWRAPPGRRGPRLEDVVAREALAALAEDSGDVLVFLPGVREIGRAAAALAPALPAGVTLAELHGALPFARQRAALRPAPAGARKVTLATAIAETSLTIEGVRTVIDAGLARRPRFDPGAGMGRLVTERVTRAEAEQRRGRAGRLGPGVCRRLWTKGEEGALADRPRPEILEADLAALALELALWGAAPAELAFLDPPPEVALAEARALLRDLGALDRDGRPTPRGRAMARLPAHPRLAHMLIAAAEVDAAGAGGAARLLPLAADLAALLEERDPLGPGAPADLALRIAALRRRERDHGADPGRLARVREAARRLTRATRTAVPAAVPEASAKTSAGGPVAGPEALGGLLARAYPDRLALLRRTPERGAPARYLLSGGKGAALGPEDPFGAPRMLAVADTDGDLREARIRRAAPVTQAELTELFADRVEEVREVVWDPRARTVRARIRRMLFALPLEERRWTDAPQDARAAAMAQGVRDLGLGALPWRPAALRLRARVAAARAAGAAELPDWSDAALAETLDLWLTPHLGGIRGAAELERLDLAGILEGGLDWGARRTLDRLAPGSWTAPTGTRVPVDWDRDPPAAAVRLQELFGLAEHPMVAGRPLLLDLLSPAGRPVQTTADLPGFWAGSYADVRKDMRGRYPRHPWPEDPLAAQPTRRARPRG